MIPLPCENLSSLLRYGHSRDKRHDLPQVVIGLAVTKEGIPVRCWVLPGNTQDMKTIEMIKNDLGVGSYPVAYGLWTGG